MVHAGEGGLPRKEFSVRSALSDAIAVFSRRAVLFSVLAGAVWLPYMLKLWRQMLSPSIGIINVKVTQTAAWQVSAFMRMLEPLLEVWFVSLLVLVITLPAALPVVLRRPAGAGEIVRRGFAQSLPLLAVTVCMGVAGAMIQAGMLVVLVAGYELVHITSASWIRAGLLTGGVLMLTLGIALWMMWSMALPVCIAEGRGLIESLRRSAALTKGRRWGLAGGFTMLFLVSLILGNMAVQTAVAAGAGLPVRVLVIWGWKAVYSALLGVFIAIVYSDLLASKEDKVTAAARTAFG